jgi:hypothetical protein
MKKILLLNLIVLMLLWTFPGSAQDPLFWVDRFDKGKMEGGAPAGWSLIVKAKEAVIKLEKAGDITFGRFLSKNSSFGIKKEFDLDIKDYSYLNWKWKVSKLPEKGNFKKSETDDQAAQLFVMFPRFPASINTEFLCYYWETEPKNNGMTGTSAAWSKAKIIVLQAGTEKLNQWVPEKRNVYEDYKRLFGKEPPSAGGVGFYINSQHTRSEAESHLGEIYFSKK